MKMVRSIFLHVVLWATVVILCATQAWSLDSSRPSSGAASPALLQIAVEVVEIDENKTQNLGIQWLDTLHLQEVAVPALFQIGSLTRQSLFADLQALLTEGAADLLANPKLVTRDGTTATFTSGGELPYVTVSSLGSANVEFKPYGVRLKISPRLEGADQIAMSLDAEVSAPDTRNGVGVAGQTVPGLSKREVNSHLLMKPGTTITMAGLIQNQKEWLRTGVPGLSRIPFLGYLFSRKVVVRKKTSIVIFVTPSILELNGHSVALVPLPPLLPVKKEATIKKVNRDHSVSEEERPDADLL